MSMTDNIPLRDGVRDIIFLQVYNPAMCLFLRSRIKYGAGFEDKQKSCAIWGVYLLRVTLNNVLLTKFKLIKQGYPETHEIGVIHFR